MTLSHPVRIALIALAAVIVIAAGAAAIAISQFDPNTLKPRIIEAVKRATGRDLTLNGKIGLKFALAPTIRLTGVGFANPPGFSRPQMATLQGLELQLGLLPLLSNQIQIDSLTLIHPDILLETTTSGQTNWTLTQEAPPTAPTGPQAPTQPGTKTRVSIDTIHIQDGTIAYRDDSTGKLTTLALSKLTATAASPDSPLHLEAAATYNGTEFAMSADTGSLSRLRDQAATTPWPIKLAVSAARAKLTADGTMTRPLQGKGYQLAVTGTVPDAAALAPLLPGLNLPPLHDVTFAAKITDTGGKIPDVSTLTLHVGASDLTTRFPGLTLTKLDIDAPKLDQPVRLDAAATLAGSPLTATGTFGLPAELLPGATPVPFPVDLTLQAAGATATAKGSIANAAAMTGANIAVAARIPDLAALSPLAFRPLPALKDVTFQATVTDNQGFRNGVALHGLTLGSSNGDLAGDATIAFARPAVTATLTSSRIDLDALQAAIEQTPPEPSASPAANPQAPSRKDRRLFSTNPIPFDLLRLADADLNLNIGLLHTRDTDTRSIATHAVLTAGKLTLDPFAADPPGGHVTGSLTVDASRPAPQVHLVLHAPSLPLKTLFEVTHQPPFATGNIEIEANLTGTGNAPHDLAASLDGTLGLAVPSGSFDNRLLGSLLGKVMDSLNTLNLVGKGGTSELRCFAVRLDARHGVAAVNPMALSSSLLTMSGMGTINLGAETLALALRPQARVAGTALVIPIAVSGPIRDPAVKVNDLGAAEANAGTVAEAIIGSATPLGIVGGLLGGDKLFGGGNADLCPQALAAARGQPIPEAKYEKPSAANPGAFLKNLFR